MNRIEGPHQGQNPNRLDPQPALAGSSPVSPDTTQASRSSRFAFLQSVLHPGRRQEKTGQSPQVKEEETVTDRTPKKGRNRMWAMLADHPTRTILTGTGLMGLVGGGAIAINVARDGGPDTPPTEPNGGHTQTVTPEPSTPPAGVTVTETPTATSVETVSPSPEPTEVEEVDKVGPYEVAYRETIGDMNFMVAKGIEEQYDATGKLTQRSLTAIVPNEDDYPGVDVRAEIEKKTMEGKYYVWKKRISENPNATFEEFLQEYKGEGDMTFEYNGFKEESHLPEKIEVDLRKLDMMYIPTKGGTVRVADNSTRFAPRNTGGRTVVEIWNPTFGQAFLDGTYPERVDYAAAGDFGKVFYVLGNEELEERGVFTDKEYNDPENREMSYLYLTKHDLATGDFLGYFEAK